MPELDDMIAALLQQPMPVKGKRNTFDELNRAQMQNLMDQNKFQNVPQMQTPIPPAPQFEHLVPKRPLPPTGVY